MQFLKPKHVLSYLDLQPGMDVAELHAGSGFYTPFIKDHIGDYGTLYNIHSEFGDIFSEDHIEIPKKVDRMIAPHVLFAAPVKKNIFTHAFNMLKSGGKFIIVETNEHNPYISKSHRTVTPEEVLMIGELAGFVREKQFTAGDYHYGIVFKKI